VSSIRRGSHDDALAEVLPPQRAQRHPLAAPDTRSACSAPPAILGLALHLGHRGPFPPSARPRRSPRRDPTRSNSKGGAAPSGRRPNGARRGARRPAARRGLHRGRHGAALLTCRAAATPHLGAGCGRNAASSCTTSHMELALETAGRRSLLSARGKIETRLRQRAALEEPWATPQLANLAACH
jgi:hypothetical protein